MSHAKTIKPTRVRHTHPVRDGKYHVQLNWDIAKSAARMAVGGVLLAVVISLVLQLAYPRSMTLPQTRIGGKSYSLKSEGQIAASIASLQGRKLSIVSGEQTLQATPKELGITFSGKKDARQATRYSWSERLVPFSFIFEHRDIPHFSFTVDEARAKKFAAGLQKYNKAPVDAVVRLDGTKVMVDKQQDGYVYESEHVAQVIKKLELTNGMTADVSPKLVQPAITDQKAAEAAGVLQQRLQQPLAVKAGGKSVTADAPLLASWVVLVPDAQNKKLHVNYDKEKVKQWLGHFANQVYVPGSPRTVTMVDGVVTSEANAADGQSLDIAATADVLIAAAVANQPSVEGKIQPVVRAAQTVRNYTRSSKGLQALITYWDQSNAGTWGIVIKDFSGSITASLNPDRQFTSASVYKIYIAYVVYTKVDNGEFGMGSPSGNGNTVSGCLDLMIVRSDNACAYALGDKIGWDANNGMLHAKGFTSTSIGQGAQLTTAQDAANYLMQLENGSLLSAANRSALLYKMGHNIYRYAIPAGSAGHSANKLGARVTFNHDVAIVYHPKGKYVLAVFSQGSNHYRIRDLARQISNVMAQ